MRDLGGRGYTGKKTQPFQRKQACGKSRVLLAGLPSCGRVGLSAELPCKRQRPSGKVSKGKMRLALPYHHLRVPLQSGEWMHGQEQGVRPWKRMCRDQHSFSEVRSGSLYGRCYRYTRTLMDKYILEPDHFMHPMHAPRAQRHIPQSLSNFQAP